MPNFFWNQDDLEIDPVLPTLPLLTLELHLALPTHPWKPSQDAASSKSAWILPLIYSYEPWLPSHRALITHLSLPLECGSHWTSTAELDINIQQMGAKRPCKKRNMWRISTFPFIRKLLQSEMFLKLDIWLSCYTSQITKSQFQSWWSKCQYWYKQSSTFCWCEPCGTAANWLSLAWKKGSVTWYNLVISLSALMDIILIGKDVLPFVQILVSFCQVGWSSGCVLRLTQKCWAFATSNWWHSTVWHWQW